MNQARSIMARPRDHTAVTQPARAGEREVANPWQ
jgi:hypothetical protein